MINSLFYFNNINLLFKKFIIFSLFLTSIFFFYSCSNTKAKSIKLNKSLIHGFIGENFQLEATIEPYDLEDKTIIWSSNNENIVKVNKKGLVSFNSIGQAIITAKIKDENKSAKCKFIVFNKKFVSVWNISHEFTLPLDHDGKYDFTIYWGDNNSTSSYINSSDQKELTHDYFLNRLNSDDCSKSCSTDEYFNYTITIIGKIEGFGVSKGHMGTALELVDIKNGVK